MSEPLGSAGGPVVVITGSTRGIGAGLAASFLDRGCAVVVSGRAPDVVAAAAGELAADHGDDRVLGVACDVTDRASLQALWDATVARFGRVDHWVLNAGVSQPLKPVWALDPADIDTVVATNLTGTLHGVAVAAQGLRGQQGGGFVWLMEGFGSDGRTTAGLAAYGATKRAVRYLAKALAVDAEDVPGLRVGTLSPGIVVTDLLTAELDESTERGRKAAKVYRVLADRVETVTPWLADRVLAASRPGTKVAWLTSRKAAVRFATAAFSRRDPLQEVS
ncbi:MAG: SDR family NAD(P)-dependent oxidoreductase [Acidimicrobiales bacterium]|nr:SDR family NAD(P)-dependent oxidoreductase [Acidimicrobiales bacterium]